jgi:hypothetical protein
MLLNAGPDLDKNTINVCDWTRKSEGRLKGIKISIKYDQT